MRVDNGTLIQDQNFEVDDNKLIVHVTDGAGKLIFSHPLKDCIHKSGEMEITIEKESSASMIELLKKFGINLNQIEINNLKELGIQNLDDLKRFGGLESNISALSKENHPIAAKMDAFLRLTQLGVPEKHCEEFYNLNITSAVDILKLPGKDLSLLLAKNNIPDIDISRIQFTARDTIARSYVTLSNMVIYGGAPPTPPSPGTGNN